MRSVFRWPSLKETQEHTSAERDKQAKRLGFSRGEPAHVASAVSQLCHYFFDFASKSKIMVRGGTKVNQFQLDVGIGTLVLTWNFQDQLSGINWFDRDPTIVRPGLFFNTRKIPSPIQNLMTQFERFFSFGEPIEGLDWEWIDQSQWSEFQKKVYKAAVKIPHGETRSYTWVAERCGSVFANRAVGQALRKNPLVILVPCHRVISSEGHLGGFMGKSDPDQPELKLKSRLISLEESFLNPSFPFWGTA